MIVVSPEPLAFYKYDGDTDEGIGWLQFAVCNLQTAEIECSLSLFQASLEGDSNCALSPVGRDRVHVSRHDRAGPHAKIYKI